MKKIVTAFILGFCFTVCSINAQAACDNYICTPPYGMTSKTSQFFSKATGQNILAEAIAGHLMKKAIKKSIDGDFKVNIDSYSVRDLKAGRFKSIYLEGKNINADGVYISNIEVKTLCDFNYIEVDKKGHSIIKENVPIGITAFINEADLNNTMLSKDYKRLVNDINSVGGSFNIFKIDSTSIKIRNNKLYYIMKIAIPFIRGTQEVVLSADLKVKNGEIKFADTELVNNRSSINMSNIASALNYINPLDFSMKILENKEADLKIKDICIVDNKVKINARMTIFKDTENQ